MAGWRSHAHARRMQKGREEKLLGLFQASPLQKLLQRDGRPEAARDRRFPSSLSLSSVCNRFWHGEAFEDVVLCSFRLTEAVQKQTGCPAQAVLVRVSEAEQSALVPLSLCCHRSAFGLSGVGGLSAQLGGRGERGTGLHEWRGGTHV